MKRNGVWHWAVSAALGVALSTAACAIDPAKQPQTYLQQARQAVQSRDAPRALAALDQAEHLWVSANVPFSDPFFHFDPGAMRAMARARQSIEMGLWSDADYYVQAAITDASTATPAL
jgi:hypothetical protein